LSMHPRKFARQLLALNRNHLSSEAVYCHITSLVLDTRLELVRYISTSGFFVIGMSDDLTTALATHQVRCVCRFHQSSISGSFTSCPGCRLKLRTILQVGISKYNHKQFPPLDYLLLLTRTSKHNSNYE